MRKTEIDGTRGERRALLPGSYDPVTAGHMDIIARTAALFDRVIVAVMTNDMHAYVASAQSKQYLFPMEVRVELLRLACAETENVTVISGEGRLIDLFDRVGATVIVKGVRNAQDYAYEQQHALWNRAHNSRAETLYLPADPRLDAVSSTRVREALAKGNIPDEFLPPAVAERLRQWEREGRFSQGRFRG